MRKELLDKGCVKKFEKAIEFELGHFYLYKRLANIMQGMGYFGAQKYFLAESAEEDTHYQKHIDFLNDYGVAPKLPTLAPETEEIASLMDALVSAFENELDLLKFYRELAKEEGEEYPEIGAYLNFFLDTQREHVGFYGDMIARLETVGKDECGILIIDKELGKKA